MSKDQSASRSEPDTVEKAFDYYWRAGHFAMHPLGGDPFAALKLWRAAWEAASASRSEQQPIVDVALCEIPHITLKEGPLYRFTKMPLCAACAAYASPDERSD